MTTPLPAFASGAELADSMAHLMLQSMLVYANKTDRERIEWWYGFLSGVVGTMASATGPADAAVICGSVQSGLRNMPPAEREQK